MAKRKNKNLQKYVSRLVELSRGTDGRIDSIRVRNILAELERERSPWELRSLLQDFYTAIARELRFSEARIEYAGTLSEDIVESIAKHFSKIYQKDIAPISVENPALLGGLRVQVGDDVYDASLAGTLAKLKAKLATA